MNFKELFEGAEPKMPGAPQGIQIMTPQQFVTKAGDEKEVDEGVRDLGYDAQSLIMKLRRDVEERRLQPTREAILAAARELAGDMDFAPELLVQQVLGKMLGEEELDEEVTEDVDFSKYPIKVYQNKQTGKFIAWVDINNGEKIFPKVQGDTKEEAEANQKTQIQNYFNTRTGDTKFFKTYPNKNLQSILHLPDYIFMGVDTGGIVYISTKPQPGWLRKSITYADGTGTGTPISKDDLKNAGLEPGTRYEVISKEVMDPDTVALKVKEYNKILHSGDKDNNKVPLIVIQLAGRNKGISESINYNDVIESAEDLSRIRKLSGLEEATKLPASSREFGGDEFQDYMKRIVGTPDVDKAGNVKLDKKGNEKYVSGKTKTDRYKMPYIHRSSVVEYVGPDGQSYSEDKIKQALAQKPKALLKQNEKMKHSNGDLEQFFNVGFAALTGIALDEQTNKLIIVNTCPGAGSCKVDCFAMKGGKVQFKAAWLSDGRILTYLLNDPDGFFSQLSAEISKEEKLGQKGGYAVTIRWHDAGDFFSPEYLDLALKMAAKHPDTKFYAYTKMAGAALGAKPPNFIINWSEGAHTSQEKQVKASDASLSSTKNSRIVPDNLFQDLLVKDEKKNLVKGSSGQWQVQPDKLPELKNRLAKEYGLSANSILNYDEYMAKRKSIPQGMKYNVIVAPGEGDISANDPNIISTLLLKH
jgi:hypothetical protein